MKSKGVIQKPVTNGEPAIEGAVMSDAWREIESAVRDPNSSGSGEIIEEEKTLHR